MSKFEIFNNINGAQVSFPLSIGGNLKSMIKGLLEKNQQQRFSYAEVKMNAWATDVEPPSRLFSLVLRVSLSSCSRLIGNKSTLPGSPLLGFHPIVNHRTKGSSSPSAV
jgi:hypothetical protein